MPEMKVDIVNCIRVQTRDIREAVADWDCTDGERDKEIERCCKNLDWLVECLEGLPPVSNSDLQAIDALMKERTA